MRTNELTDDALHFAVAVAEGWEDFDEEDNGFTWHREKGSAWLTLATFRPSELWEQGGPIIEEQKIITSFDRFFDSAQPWRCAVSINPFNLFEGRAPLIAAMRCYVDSKLGEEVDIPSGIA